MRITFFLVKSSAVAAMGGLLFGFDTAVISGTTQDLVATYNLSPALLGITVSSALWGTIIGAFVSGILAEHLGRRDSLRILAILYLISAVASAAAWNWSTFIAFRVVGGLAIGGSSVLGPMYIAEIAPPKQRGLLVGFFQLSIVAGILTAYFSNYLIGLAHLGIPEWRWMIGVAALPTVFFFGMLYGIPRSPRWLVQKGFIEEAGNVLEMTCGNGYEFELQSILDSIVLERRTRNTRLFERAHAFPMFLVISTALFNQLSGINAVLYYLNFIFVSAGFGMLSASIQAVAVGIILLIFTIVGMFAIDRVGRKTLLLIGSTGTAMCLAIVAFILIIHRYAPLLIWALGGYIACFAFSQGAVIWVYISEVFPNSVRAKGQSLGSLSHWSMNALISMLFPMIAAVSGAYPFLFFAAMMVLQFLVVLFIFPETKGLSLEKVQETFGHH